MARTTSSKSCFSADSNNYLKCCFWYVEWRSSWDPIACSSYSCSPGWWARPLQFFGLSLCSWGCWWGFLICHCRDWNCYSASPYHLPVIIEEYQCFLALEIGIASTIYSWTIPFVHYRIFCSACLPAAPCWIGPARWRSCSIPEESPYGSPLSND